jgi:hypothetical protein
MSASRLDALRASIGAELQTKGMQHEDLWFLACNPVCLGLTFSQLQEQTHTLDRAMAEQIEKVRPIGWCYD